MTRGAFLAMVAACCLTGCSTPQEARLSETVIADQTTSDPEIEQSPMPPTFWAWCEADMKAKGQVAIHGEVRRPGVYELPSPPLLAACIATAGGCIDVRELRTYRGGENFVYELRAIEENHVEAVSGDRIELSRSNASINEDWMPPRWKKAKAYYAAIHKACDSGAYCDGECVR